MNIKKAVKNAKNGEYYGDRILGDKGSVDAFASFFRKHEDNLETVKLGLLLSYVDTQSFTPEELASYKRGLSDFVTVFISCKEESDMRAKKAEQEKDLQSS